MLSIIWQQSMILNKTATVQYTQTQVLCYPLSRMPQVLDVGKSDSG